MRQITMVELRRDAEKIIEQIKQGQSMVLTYRGKPVVRLEPISQPHQADDDPFYSLHELAVSAGESLTNREIDEILYDR